MIAKLYIAALIFISKAFLVYL